MDLYNYTDAGLLTDGKADARSPERWLAWHFTPYEYLSDILSSGGLLSDNALGPRPGSVADPGIKASRAKRVVRAANYPPGRSVSTHVPAYFAAKSPMLFRVKRNFPQERIDSLVFLGVRLGDVFNSGCEWVASNGNAASSLAQFSTDAPNLGSFVDFPLLTAKWWGDTPDDPHRKHRRAAELLVYDRLPFELIRAIAVSSQDMADATLAMIAAAGYRSDHIHTLDSMTFLKD